MCKGFLFSASPAEFAWTGFNEFKHLQRQRTSRDGSGRQEFPRVHHPPAPLGSQGTCRGGKVQDPHPWVPTAPSPAKPAAGGCTQLLHLSAVPVCTEASSQLFYLLEFCP